MARILNNTAAPVSLSGYVIPAGQGSMAFNGFTCTAPGVLVTTNDVIRGDWGRACGGLIAAGLLAVELDPEGEDGLPIAPVAEPAVAAELPAEEPAPKKK